MEVTELKHKTILKVLTGSHCHGTNMPGSDRDIRGVCIPSLHYFFGLKNFEQFENRKDDIVIYGISKFIKLATKGNLSALNFLFTRERERLYVDAFFGHRLLDFRENFLTKNVINCIFGYCNSQLNRMKRGSGRSGNRQDLIDKYGYDTKFAYHAVMVTNIGVELLKTGTYHAWRPPAEQKYLRSIRTGNIEHQEVMERIKENLTAMNTLEGFKKLPDKPDTEKISEFSVGLITDYFKWRKEL